MSNISYFVYQKIVSRISDLVFRISKISYFVFQISYLKKFP